jgi:N-acetylmuramoyl-L-alanine amidase
MADWNLPTSVPASNFQSGRGGVTLDRIVVHHTWGSLASAQARFNQDGSQVSAHVIVARDGSLLSLVDIGDTAFHAGDFAYNERSVGIEFESSQGDVPEFTDIQYSAGHDLIDNIGSRQGFALDGSSVVPHSAVVPTACPGGLDIGRLLAGLVPSPLPPPLPPPPPPLPPPPLPPVDDDSSYATAVDLANLKSRVDLIQTWASNLGFKV